MSTILGVTLGELASSCDPTLALCARSHLRAGVPAHTSVGTLGLGERTVFYMSPEFPDQGLGELLRTAFAQGHAEFQRRAQMPADPAPVSLAKQLAAQAPDAERYAQPEPLRSIFKL